MTGWVVKTSSEPRWARGGSDLFHAHRVITWAGPTWGCHARGLGVAADGWALRKREREKVCEGRPSRRRNVGRDVTKTSRRCDEEEEPLKAARVGRTGAAVERLGREVTLHGSHALSG